MSTQVLGIFGLPGGSEWLFIGVLGLLLFGKRLPDIARSMGKSIVEFKRGLHDVKDEIDQSATEPRALPEDRKVDSASQGKDRVPAAKESPE